MSDTAKIIALAKAVMPEIDQAAVESAVSDWLDDHPEATTTVEDGSITKAKLDSNLQGTVDDVSDLKNQINGLTVEETLLRSDLPGTTVTVTFDSNNNPVSIVHSASGTTVRTDAFVWGTDTVTETRTTSDKYITITTDLITLAQTVSAIQEVA